MLSVVFRNVAVSILKGKVQSSAGQMADDDDLNTAYQPPPSLWKLIESYTSGHELPEVKRLLGESLVEQSQELHEEVGR